MKRFYAGIGSRSCPPDQCRLITHLALQLGPHFTMRSGGAEGADKAFEYGSLGTSLVLRPKDSTPAAEEIARQIHPAWHMCNDYARKLHGRNIQLILGKNLDEPAEFVLAWTLNPTMGGTRTGIVLAKQRGIPVYNLAMPDELQRASEFIMSFNVQTVKKS